MGLYCSKWRGKILRTKWMSNNNGFCNMLNKILIIYNIIRKKITASCILYIQCIDFASSLICSLFKRWIFAVQQNYTGLNHTVLYRLQAGSELMNSIYFFSSSYWVIKCIAVYQLFVTAGWIAPALTFSVRYWIMWFMIYHISWVRKWH